MKRHLLRQSIRIVFSQMPTDIAAFWKILIDYLKQHDALPDKFRLSQIAGFPDSQRSEQYLEASPLEISDIIATHGLTAFWVDTGHSPTSVAYRLHQFHFTRGVEEKAKAPEVWSPFLELIVSRFETIGGWEPHALYDSWQNLHSPDSYDRGAYGPMPPGFKTQYEPDKYGIGPGQNLFEKTINPGRSKTINHRCIFFPTAEMWLGPHFWQYAKCTMEEALAADFFIEKRDTPNYLYLKCWPDSFTRPDGEQGRMQQRLWKLFFHEDCEWPPGSGTICDEPMYGPPELTPSKA
jgi:hypothetical protein